MWPLTASAGAHVSHEGASGRRPFSAPALGKTRLLQPLKDLGWGSGLATGQLEMQIQSLPSSSCSSRLPLPWKQPLTTSPSLDITPCVSSLSSLGHYSPYLTLGSFFKLATPSSLKLFCLLNNVICSVDYPCTSNTSPLKSLSSTCIFVLGAHFYSLSR